MKIVVRSPALILLLGLITVVLAMSSCARRSDESAFTQAQHKDESTPALLNDIGEGAEMSVTQTETSQETAQAETQPEILTEAPSLTALGTPEETAQESAQEGPLETVSETSEAVIESSEIPKETSQQGPVDYEAETAADLTGGASSGETIICPSDSNELPPVIDED